MICNVLVFGGCASEDKSTFSFVFRFGDRGFFCTRSARQLSAENLHLGQLQRLSSTCGLSPGNFKDHRLLGHNSGFEK